MKRLCERYAPLPMVTQEVPIPGVPRTYIDFYQGMYDMLTHLIAEHGYRKIAFIRGPEESITAEERYQAYCDALRHSGIFVDERLVAPGAFFTPSGKQAVHTLLDIRQLRPGIDIQAIVAVNDFTAFDAIESLQQRGIRIPQEVAVTGFDDSDICHLTTPSLTTARISLESIGRPLVELLLDQIAGQSVPEQVLLPAKVVLRESCGCLDRAMVRAVALNTEECSDLSLEEAVAERRTSILDALEQAAEKIGPCLPPHWTEQLLDAFIKLILNDSSGNEASLHGHFWAALDRLFHDAAASNNDMAIWHDVFSELRRHLLPCFDDPALLAEGTHHRYWQR